MDFIGPDCILQDQSEHVLRGQTWDEGLKFHHTLLVLRGVLMLTFIFITSAALLYHLKCF